MRTEATVVAMDGKIAVVETERTSACDGCHKSAGEQGCAMCSLMGSQRKIRARAYNTVGANVGDRVVIESATGRMLWYAALVFLLPLLLSILFWWISTLFTQKEAWQIACAALGFVGSFLVVFFYSGQIQKKRCDVEITEIL